MEDLRDDAVYGLPSGVFQRNSGLMTCCRNASPSLFAILSPNTLIKGDVGKDGLDELRYSTFSVLSIRCLSLVARRAKWVKGELERGCLKT